MNRFKEEELHSTNLKSALKVVARAYYPKLPGDWLISITQAPGFPEMILRGDLELWLSLFTAQVGGRFEESITDVFKLEPGQTPGLIFTLSNVTDDMMKIVEERMKNENPHK